MKDVQKDMPKVNVPIQKVGITGLKLPISVRKKNDYYQFQSTIADIDAFVDLDKNSKGIHMSRLIIGIHESTLNVIDQTVIGKIAKQILIDSGASRAELIYRFPYFIGKLAPVSKKLGIIHCDVKMSFIYYQNNSFETGLEVKCITTSLCPCSKEISKYGAHNQRSKITVSGKNIENEYIWIEDIVKLIEKNSSSEMYSVLKRPDEKYVTEQAYENPNFVEDSCRNIYQDILDTKVFSEFVVRVENEESIHLHNAVAEISYPYGE